MCTLHYTVAGVAPIVLGELTLVLHPTKWSRSLIIVRGGVCASFSAPSSLGLGFSPEGPSSSAPSSRGLAYSPGGTSSRSPSNKVVGVLTIVRGGGGGASFSAPSSLGLAYSPGGPSSSAPSSMPQALSKGSLVL